MDGKETQETLTAKYADRIKEILAQSELNSVSAKKIRSTLELEFQVDLSSCKKEINEVIQEIFIAFNEQSTSTAGQDPEGHEDETQGEIDESDLSDVIDDKTRKRKAKKKEPASKGKKVKKPRQKKPVDPNAPKPITAFTAPVILSEKLSRLLKADRLPRTEVIKRLWMYIKENKLQDPKDGRNILCDSTLKDLFQVDEVTSFQMAKIIGPHLTKLPAEELQALKDQSKLNVSNLVA